MSVKVSVIVPVYNVEEYLNECLDSLLNQTLKEIEVICVDDGSTDRSLDILYEYAKKDERVKVLTQKNQYAGVARNNGMKVATGEYLIFLDSDDFFEPDLCQLVYEKGKSTNSDIVFFGARRYDTGTKETVEAPWYFRNDFVKDTPVFNRKNYPERILSLVTPAPWTKAYHRDFVEKHQLQYQALQNSNDAYFSLIAVSVAERISWVDKVLVNYRVGMSTNLQATKQKNPLCFMKAYRAVYDELNRLGIYKEVEQSFVHVAISGLVFNLNSIKNQESLNQIYDCMNSPLFTEMNLMGYPEEFYLNKGHYKEALTAVYIAKEHKERLKRQNHSGEYEVIQYASGVDHPLVSVIIPIYNVEEYLGECLESIVNQTLHNIEIICVNDGTKDNSMQIVLDYAKKDDRITVITQQNIGLSGTRNHGFEVATGKYVHFMDSDDKMALNALEELAAHMEKYSLDMLCFDAHCFGDEEEVAKNRDYYRRKHDYPECTSGIELFTLMSRKHEFRVTQGIQIYRREHLIEQGLKFHEHVIHEDNPFSLLALVSAKRAGFVHKEYFLRRFRPESIMTSKKSFKNVYGYYTVAMDILHTERIYEKYSDESKELIYEFVSRLFWNAISIYAELTEEEKKAYKALDIDEQVWFKNLVVTPGDYRTKLYSRKPIQLFQTKKTAAKPKKWKIKRKKHPKRAKHPLIYYVYKIAERSPKRLVNFVKKIFDFLGIPY